MSKGDSKTKKNDQFTILWALFRDQAQKLNALRLDPRESSLKEGHWLREAISWMEGEQFQVNELMKPDYENPSWEIPKDGHDKVCPIFKASGYLNKTKVLSALIKEDPRWLYDRCGVELYFQAASESNYRFFNEIGKHLKKSKTEKTKNDLDHIKWFVSKHMTPILISQIPESERKKVLGKMLKSIHQKALSIINSLPELEPLKGQAIMKDYISFQKTCTKWYLKN